MAGHGEKTHSDEGGIEAASATYKRCTRLLLDELGADPVNLGLGPRQTFEEAVTLLRAELGRRETDDPAIVEPELTEEDFSFNEVLRMLRLTAIGLALPKRHRVTREHFIRQANAVLQDEGGLRGVSKLFPKAKTGRYAWIEGHIQTFLHRHRGVARRSKRYPDCLRIMASKPREG